MEDKTHELSAPIDKVSFAPNSRRQGTPLEKLRRPAPGALYNYGNLLALGGGAAVSLSAVWGHSSLFTALQTYLIGSPDAAWLTASMLVFILSGEVYRRADLPYAPASLLYWGDFGAGIAAILLTVALVAMGETTAALIAGLMLSCGKLGSALLPLLGLREAARFDRWLRLTVVASRAPSILALGLAVASGIAGGAPFEQITLPLIMILCFFLWLWADLLLLARG